MAENEVVEEVAEAPVEEAKAETPVEEAKVEAPLEEAKAEAPAASKVADTSVSMEEMKEEIENSFKKGAPRDDDPVWENFQKLLDEKEIFEVKVETAVKGGVIAMVEDVKAFIPASKLAKGKVENLEEYKGKKLDVTVITVDQDKKKLVLSALDAIRAKERAARAEAIAKIKEGDILTGKVDSLKDYGAFIALDGGASGLLHVAQISWKRVKLPKDVLEIGQEVKVKVTAVKDGKISLSMKALEEAPERAPRRDEDRPRRSKEDGPSSYHDGEKVSTSLGSLLSGIKL